MNETDLKEISTTSPGNWGVWHCAGEAAFDLVLGQDGTNPGIHCFHL